MDDEDYEELNQWNWTVMKDKKTGLLRACRFFHDGLGRRRVVLMHRTIMCAPEGKEVDHIDRNGLNNVRDNLRLASHSQNLQNRTRFRNNTTGFKGVVRLKDGKYRMQFTAKFATPEEAAAAYDRCAHLIYGEFANVNESTNAR